MCVDETNAKRKPIDFLNTIVMTHPSFRRALKLFGRVGFLAHCSLSPKGTGRGPGSLRGAEKG
eukprot:15170073-Heterocapsa_arctica.AAC.1